MNNLPISIYTTLFSLGKIPNKYIDMILIWFHYISKFANLQSNDSIIVLVDNETYDYIKNDVNYNIISQKLVRQITYEVFSKPANILEGLLQRYQLKPSIEKRIYMHIDIDTLILKDVRSILKDSADFWYISEGDLLHKDYGGHFFSDKNLEKESGYSPSVFAWIPKKIVTQFFSDILSSVSHESNFYTADQPYYNKNIHEYRSQNKFKTVEIKEIANNIFFETQDIPDSVAFLNFCGKPGDDSFHFQKIFQQFLLSVT